MTLSKVLRSPWFYFLLLLVGGGLYIKSKMDQLAPSPTIKDSPTTIIGFNHIGISVKDLDAMVAFYESATNFKVAKRYKVTNDPSADALHGMDNISYKRAILQGPNMLLELTEYDNQQDQPIKMLPQGPGMTHTCYQTASERSPGYDQFKTAGAEILSRGDEAIDLGGYGVTYAYGYDPEGNMMELEQMSNFVIWLKIGKSYAKKHPMWMTQVAIMTPDLKRLTDYYQKVLAIEPYRVGEYRSSIAFDQIIDQDSAAFDGAWFMLDTQDKKMELMQYVNPMTPDLPDHKKVTDLGYTYSFEVENIQKEYARLTDLGIDFISTPQKMEDFWAVIARDIDGNYYSFRQAIDPASTYSINNF